MGLGKGEGLSVVRDLLRQCGGFAVVDGGLATELERHGADLNDPLWSAKCLISFPQLIKRVYPFLPSNLYVVYIYICIYIYAKVVYCGGGILDFRSGI